MASQEALVMSRWCYSTTGIAPGQVAIETLLLKDESAVKNSF